MFSWRYSIHEMATFGRFLGLFSPKYGSSLLKLQSGIVSHETKTFSEQSFKIKCLSRNGTHPKLTVLVHFGAQFTPGKPKILPKNKIFPETESLLLPTNTSTRSQINHRILIKLIKKNPFLGQKIDFLR